MTVNNYIELKGNSTCQSGTLRFTEYSLKEGWMPCKFTLGHSLPEFFEDYSQFVGPCCKQMLQILMIGSQEIPLFHYCKVNTIV